MRKALVALVGTVVVGVLLSPAPAAAKEFAFQGGEPFGSSPVGMTMTGKSFDQPRRVTGFSIGADVVVGDCPGYNGPDPITLPIHSTTKAGIPIRRAKNGQLNFRWHYQVPGGPDEDLQGVQLGPRKWIGEFSYSWLPGHPPGGSDDCWSNYQDRWKAEFTGLI